MLNSFDMARQRDEAFRQRDEAFHQRDEAFRQRDEAFHQRDEAFHQRDEAFHQRDEAFHQRDEPISERDSRATLRPDDTIPCVLFNTLPKSASVFIHETLASTLNKPMVSISPGYFPRDQIDFRALERLKAMRGIAQSHLDASVFNQRYINEIPKVIIQFRDPRQALLSWLHHLERLSKERQAGLLFAVWPPLPDTYFGYSMSRKIDYQIEHYLPQVIAWQMEWVDFIDHVSDADHYMLNSYEAFVADPVRYFNSILRFVAGTEADHVVVHEVTPTTEKNFRKGQVDEWREVFSSKQISNVTKAIPISLSARLGWQ